MTNKVGAVAKPHPPRDIRYALLGVFQQPAGVAQPGAANKFPRGFAKLGVEQAVKLPFAQLNVLGEPGGRERVRQVLFDNRHRPAQPRIGDQGDVRRSRRNGSMGGKREASGGGGRNVVTRVVADQRRDQRQRRDPTGAGQHVAFIDKIETLLGVNQREPLRENVVLVRMNRGATLGQQTLLCQNKAAGANTYQGDVVAMGLSEKRSVAGMPPVEMVQAAADHCDVVEGVGRGMGGLRQHADTRTAYHRLVRGNTYQAELKGYFLTALLGAGGNA